MLAGGDTAATELLRRHGLGRLITALNPAVSDAMDRAGAARRYKRFVKGSQFGGLFQAPPLDLDAYVVGRTVDGLFHAIGEEERRIRTSERGTARGAYPLAPLELRSPRGGRAFRANRCP